MNEDYYLVEVTLPNKSIHTIQCDNYAINENGMFLNIYHNLNNGVRVGTILFSDIRRFTIRKVTLIYDRYTLQER